jgi:hypothetical protein
VVGVAVVDRVSVAVIVAVVVMVRVGVRASVAVTVSVEVIRRVGVIVKLAEGVEDSVDVTVAWNSGGVARARLWKPKVVAITTNAIMAKCFIEREPQTRSPL